MKPLGCGPKRHSRLPEPVLRELCRMRGEGISASRIAHVFNERRIATSQGAEYWHAASVVAVLRSRRGQAMLVELGEMRSRP